MKSHRYLLTLQVKQHDETQCLSVVMRHFWDLGEFKFGAVQKYRWATYLVASISSVLWFIELTLPLSPSTPQSSTPALQHMTVVLTRKLGRVEVINHSRPICCVCTLN